MRIKYAILNEAVECTNCDALMGSEGSPTDAQNWEGDAVVIQYYRCPTCNRFEEHTIVISARRRVLNPGMLWPEKQS